MQHDMNALLYDSSTKEIRAMLCDILQGNATVEGTLEALQERLADRTWSELVEEVPPVTTYKIKAYSRTTSEDDASKLTRFEYNGSFRASEADCGFAFNCGHETYGRSILMGWAKMMDCFYDVLFIRVDTDETVSFNQYEEI